MPPRQGRDEAHLTMTGLTINAMALIAPARF